MDTLRFHEKFQKQPMFLRNQILSDTIVWLEKEEKVKCAPENLPKLLAFKEELTSQLNQSHVPQVWAQHLMTTYSSMPFYERFIRKMLY